jgi:hypothetical protein
MCPVCTSQPPTRHRRFVANKGLTVIRQPYDSLVEALFLFVLPLILAKN